MDVELPAGKYVVAVSGGVDSVVLLHLLAQGATKSQPNSKAHATYHLPPTTYQLIVAHFDHGIRPDSTEDRQLVQGLAAQYDVPFVYERAELGAGASEAVARKARYDFLRRVKEEHQADAIVTAHHQDDVLETIIINWLRGTKSRGLSSLRSTPEIRRPLLGWSKQQIRTYAHLHKLQWREDSTNEDESYLRNYIRRQLMPKLSAEKREQLLAHSERAASLNDAISAVTNEYLAAHTTSISIDRGSFKALPDEAAREILASWLRSNTSAVITTKLLERLVRALRTGRNNSLADIEQGYSFAIGRTSVELVSPASTGLEL